MALKDLLDSPGKKLVYLKSVFMPFYQYYDSMSPIGVNTLICLLIFYKMAATQLGNADLNFIFINVVFCVFVCVINMSI